MKWGSSDAADLSFAGAAVLLAVGGCRMIPRENQTGEGGERIKDSSSLHVRNFYAKGEN